MQLMQAAQGRGEVIDQDALNTAKKKDKLQRRGGIDDSGVHRPGKAGGGARGGARGGAPLP